MEAFGLHQWFKRSPTQQRPIRRRDARLRLEHLEERWLPSISATPHTLHLQEGIVKSEIVATFTDTDPSPVTKYSIGIDWGDGTPLDTTSAVVSRSGSIFSITAKHAYAEETLPGTPYAVTVYIAESNGSDQDKATAVGAANVADLSPQATGGFSFTATEGLTSTNQTLVTFTDPGGPETLANYSASIQWGDGSTSPGTITSNSGLFTVSGSHLYTEEGAQTITVTIHHDLASDVIVRDSAKIADPPVALTANNYKVRAFEGINTGLQTVATFSDPGGAEPLTHYSATINWGDNSSSAGVITFNPSTQVFTVQGSHTYAEENAYVILVTIHHEAAQDVIATAFADMSVVGVGGFTVHSAEGANSGSQTVATFTDPGESEGVSNYSATIDWGDGQASAGTISFNSTSGVFTVAGSHTYAEEGGDTITVTIHHDSASDATVTSAAQVSDVAVNADGGFTVSTAEGNNSASQTVATFTDPAGAESTADYSATIDWGDGSNSPGVITFNSTNSTFTVSGSHAYAEEGSDTITGTIHHDSAADVTVTSTAQVGDQAVSATGGFTVTATEGGNSGSQTVATFSDPGGPEALNDYTATIDWGDGNTSAGLITFDSSTQLFTVSGSNTYAEENAGAAYTVQVTIQHDSAPDAVVTSSAQVVDRAVNGMGGFAVTAAEGSASASQIVASFTDPAGPEAVSNYSATIDWGDNSNSSGVITFNSSTDVFSVSGSHTYAEEGSDTIHVTIHHDAAADVVVTSTAQVSDVAVIANGGFSVTAVEGSSSASQTVATFTDPAGSEPVADYSATINWGDGSTSAGAITSNSTNNTFAVNGSHIYAEEGSDTITVTIHHDVAADAVVTSTAQVSDPAVAATGGFQINVGEASSIGSQTVATFTDPGGVELPGKYSANISWGDGTSSTGTITLNSATGVFTVSDSHTYAEQGSYAITVTIQHEAAPASTVTSSALVRVVSDIAGMQNGEWWVAASNGSNGATNLKFGNWDPSVTWVDVLTGDFNGDGRTDYVGRDLQTGQIWVALSTGSSFTTSRWDQWNPDVTWADVKVGDFTGDGKDDLVGRVAQSGEIWVAVSTGSSFITTKWTTWNPRATWVDTQVGDFTGDGKADYTARDLGTGAWWTGVSTGSSFTTSLWTMWNNQVTWVDVRVGDFNGDGKKDIVGRVQQSGEIWVGQSTGSSFVDSLWTRWSTGVTWVDVQVGDFTGDGKDDLLGRVAQTSEIWVAKSTGSSFIDSKWTTWNPAATWVDMQVADLTGNGLDDLIGRDAGTGAWWAGLSNGSSGFTTTYLWTFWNNTVNWVDVHTGDFV